MELYSHPKGKLNVSKDFEPFGDIQRSKYDADFHFDSTRPYEEDNEFENFRNIDRYERYKLNQDSFLSIIFHCGMNCAEGILQLNYDFVTVITFCVKME